MRTCTTIAVFSFVILATLVSMTAGSNSTWGHRGYYDRMLYRTPLVRKSDLWRIITVDFDYPPKYAYNPYNNFYISEVRATDHKRKNGGYALLRKGGPGYRNVTLQIVSERNHGLNYTIEIYGH